MPQFKHVVATFLLTAVFAVGGVGILAMMSDYHHVSGCPFMPGEQAICQMDAFDHIAAWQKTFTTVLPSIISLIFLAAVAVFFWKYYDPPDLLTRQQFPKHRYRPLGVSVVAELFESGILSPRAP